MSIRLISNVIDQCHNYLHNDFLPRKKFVTLKINNNQLLHPFLLTNILYEGDDGPYTCITTKLSSHAFLVGCKIWE
jgi:hypothetical protein